MSLTLKIKKQEIYLASENMFIDVPEQTVELEHSLLSLSKWESKWHIPFLNKPEERTKEQIYDYIRCMVINETDVDPSFVHGLTSTQIEEIKEYLDNKMTATTIMTNYEDPNKPKKRQIVTAELLYYWISQAGFDISCERWHLNRLMMLLQVASVESQKDKKMTKGQTLVQQNALNKARRAKRGVK